MSAHDFDAEHAAAVAEIAALIAPRLLPGIDADYVAERAVTALHERGWRPIPRPQPIQRRPAGDPPSAEWRAAADRIRSRTEAAAEAAQ